MKYTHTEREGGGEREVERQTEIERKGGGGRNNCAPRQTTLIDTIPF
jgi:hypothetical protein